MTKKNSEPQLIMPGGMQPLNWGRKNGLKTLSKNTQSYSVCYSIFFWSVSSVFEIDFELKCCQGCPKKIELESKN